MMLIDYNYSNICLYSIFCYLLVSYYQLVCTLYTHIARLYLFFNLSTGLSFINVFKQVGSA